MTDPLIVDAIMFVMIAAVLALLLAVIPDEKPKRKGPWA
jgi:hypothetical protein